MCYDAFNIFQGTMKIKYSTNQVVKYSKKRIGVGNLKGNGF